MPWRILEGRAEQVNRKVSEVQQDILFKFDKVAKRQDDLAVRVLFFAVLAGSLLIGLILIALFK